jgi:hypothetical protein
MRHAVVAGIAWAAYVLSWFLPVVRFKPGGLFTDIDAGWKAFLLALSLVVKPDRLDVFWGLCVVGVLGNVPVLASPWMLRDPVPRRFITYLAAAFVLNLAWIVVMRDSVLLAGYWLWVGSMGALAVAAMVKRWASVAPPIHLK